MGHGRNAVVSSWSVTPPARPDTPILVLARLDGSVLDPYTSSLTGDAAGAIGFFVRSRTPIVFFSSRTRAQLELIQHQMGLRHPFVAENGGAAYVPRGYFGVDLPQARLVAGYQAVAFGMPYSQVVDQLQDTAQRLGVRVVGFNDLSVHGVADECNLSVLEARLAKLREYDEPFRVVEGGDAGRDRLTRALRTAGLQCLTTGRYSHVGAAVDQRRIVSLIRGWYEQAWGTPVVTVGLADATSDLPLLCCADVPLLMGTDDVEPAAHEVAGTPGGALPGIATASDRTEALLEIARTLRRRIGKDLVPLGCRN
jgi:mannosyl-3-phosphoglycerate phosphatase